MVYLLKMLLFAAWKGEKSLLTSALRSILHGISNCVRYWQKLLPIFHHLPQMPIDPRLSAQEVFEIHKAAVTRDFVAKPRLGKVLEWLFCSITRKKWWLEHLLTFFVAVDYNTVSGVNGPLVILDNVKACIFPQLSTTSTEKWVNCSSESHTSMLMHSIPDSWNTLVDNRCNL